MSQTDKCHRQTNVTDRQMSQTDKCHRQINVTDRQMSQTDPFYRHTYVTYRQMSHTLYHTSMFCLYTPFISMYCSGHQ